VNVNQKKRAPLYEPKFRNNSKEGVSRQVVHQMEENNTPPVSPPREDTA